MEVIFKPELFEKVISGEKTVTRRIATGAPCRYLVGQDYAVQPGRTKRSAGRIRVTAVSLEALAEIAASGEPEREGFATLAEFVAFWKQLHKSEFNPRQPVYRIAFTLVSRRR